ncbi:JmjC-domain-containing protein [Suhomyces tanzawaensis NRRL Y-17324]|uniref:[histone H3]-trimethyl-L-lysine(9) demethylase n=1 Tax=Suhomyces tanzawaensis NRRL Y-17324 TaxID=984487 RepID=A0A1E4SFU2_9ASCO|nr:JmjC-domain-containing protein [Suhomyces tanzawaensis NRRL Y-17324]ODV78381.1 JmjC-domain-containing protein [Suhomyces tanzawaensis NRRL Y-17324]
MPKYSHDPNLVIEPHHYSGGIPVFQPSMAEFEDFYKFNKAINKYGMKSGIVKIVPPKEWSRQVSTCYTKESLELVKIKNPIVQQINSTCPGVFSLQNIEKLRTFNMFQWKEVSEKTNYQPPAPKGKSRQSVVSSKPSVDDICRVDTSEFTPERCEELEKNYWRTLTYAEPMYGADLMGSLFSSSIKSWNVAHLPNILDLMDVKLPGVNEAYLYAGLWKASFAWHLEDQDLYSINYLHFGAPKQWYLIPQDEAPKFFELMKDTFNDEYNVCHEFLRHKTFLVSPQFLDKHDVKYNKIVHNEGEFIITYPYGYHAGFNYGYNLAESVNFALDDWFPIGQITKKCECIHDSVGINVKQIICKFHGIPYTDDVLSEATPVPVMPTETPKRRILNPQKNAQKKKQRVAEDFTEAPLESECYLCPNSYAQSAIGKHPFFELYQTDLLDKEGSPYRVHKICVSMFPDQLRASRNGDGSVLVTGVGKISKNQKKLKCLVCRRGSSKGNVHDSGACFQCTHPKCTRSFHGTCGISGGVSLNFEESRFLCRFHRPKSSESLEQDMMRIPMHSWIQFAFNNNLYSGIVLSNNSSESTFKVMIYPSFTDVLEIPYQSVFPGVVPVNTLHMDERILDPVRKRASDSAISYTNLPQTQEHGPKGNYTASMTNRPEAPVYPKMGIFRELRVIHPTRKVNVPIGDKNSLTVNNELSGLTSGGR